MSKTFYKKAKRRFKVLMIWAVASCTALTTRAEIDTLKQRPEVKPQKLNVFLKDLEKHYQVNFVYDAAEINKEAAVNIAAKNHSLESALSQLSPYNIGYKIISSQVILKKVNTADQKGAVVDVTITGKVQAKNAKGSSVEDMPGVTILEKGTNNGTATDAEGNYRLTVKEGAVLVVSMVGYKTQEIAVGNRTSINIMLAQDENQLQEVVVTGYQTIDKKLFTGASTSINASDVKMEGTIDASRMLEGRVAGVSVQNVSGTFGAAPKVRVRGATSISGENKPLWVVDGVVLEDIVNISNDQLSSGDPSTLIGSSVAGINSDDIESFNILKDASATALYGARAMNGVVVITTKRGRVGKPLVSYTGNYSTFLKPNYSTFNIMNSADQMSLYAEVQRKGGLNSSIANGMHGGVFAKMYQLMDLDESTNDFRVRNTPEGKAAFLERYARVNTDWFDVLFRNSFVQEHSLSVSSGSDKSQHYISGSFYNDNGWTIADNVKRYTINARGNYNLSDKFTAGIITTGSIRQQRAPGTLGRTNNVVEGRYNRDFDINPFSYALNTSRTLTPYDENGELEYFTRNYAPFNIINESKNNYIDLDVLDLKLQGELGYKIMKNLEFKTLGAIRYVKTTSEHEITEYSNMATAYRYAPNSTIADANIFLYDDPDKPYITDRESVLPQGGFYNRKDDNLINYYARNTINWSPTFSNIHLVNVMVGQEVKYTDRENSFSNGYGYQYDKGGVPFTDYRIIKQMLEGNYNYFGLDKFQDRYASFFTSGSYSYNGKYVFTGSARYDGSNRLGASRSARWLPTWTLSGAWNVDTEPFMYNLDKITYLKLRASYGLTASMGSANNSTVVLQNSSSLRPVLTEVESRIVLSSLENSELTWEKQYETNVGMDVAFLENKVNLTVDLYKRDGFDLISGIRTSGIGGQVTKQANYADMESKGLEVTLGNRVLQTPKFNWRSNFTFGYNKNKITNLKSQPRIYDLIIPEGGPKEGGAVRGLYSIDFKELDKYGTPIFLDETNETSNNVYLQDLETGYLTYEGSVDPIITGGFSNTFTYGPLSFNAFFSYQTGNKIRLNPVFKAAYNDTDALPKEFRDRWTLPGDQELVDIPATLDYRTRYNLSSVYPYNAYNYSTVRVADGSFVRLKTASLVYNLPAKWVSKIHGNSLSVSLVGTNLWLLYSDSKLKGQDPEFFSSGGVALPVPKQLTLSVKIGI